MREILFRAKSDAGQKWAYGDLLTIKYRDGTTDYSIMDQSAVGGVTTIDPETIGQYTGLMDKNGKKVFEGDVILDEYKNTYVVRYDCNIGGFMFESIGCDYGTLYPVSWVLDGAVIGNIYDNPELLEVEQ